MGRGSAGRAAAIRLTIVVGALGCGAPSRSVVADLPPAANAEPERFADAQLGGPAADLEAGEEHPLDALVMRIVAAAESEDFEALGALMSDDFVTMEELGREAVIATLREDPRRHLGNLTALLRGDCAFADSPERLICPRSLVETVTEYGDALRTHFELVDGAWHWVAYVPSDTVELDAPRAFSRPSESPVLSPPELPPGTPGAPDSDPVRRVIRAHLHEVRACYTEGLARVPGLRGRVVIRFTIGPTGDVLDSVVHDRSLPDQRVAACITKAVLGWRFPSPEGGGNVLVTYPFAFEPG